ncbi:MAG: prepilin-type N-terminal cleavage/methylation domain-containing protein [Planctomycetes bacterium]|nr:prepilin-type N-terminal cleavage/methylation domain-containing protein [Planctomycetota bacterium]
MIDRSQNSRGFTVAELIVAMSISAVMLLSGYEFFQALKTTGEGQSQDLAATATVVHGLGRIREDLLHSLPKAGSSEPIFAGSNPSLEWEEETTRLLEFYSLCTGYGDDYFRGLRQMYHVSYELVKTEDSICLYRSAVPVVGAGLVSGHGDRELILEHVEQIKITFHNGKTSEPNFSSNEKLPAGVELNLKAYGQAWALSVKLPCGSLEGQS